MALPMAETKAGLMAVMMAAKMPKEHDWAGCLDGNCSRACLTQSACQLVLSWWVHHHLVH